MNTELTTPKQRLLLGRLMDESAGRSFPRPTFTALFDVLGLSSAVNERCAEMLATVGLSEGRFAVLLLLEQRPALTPAELAENLGVTRATITGLIAGLERQDLLVREADSSDGRRTRLALTAAGLTAIAEIIPAYSQWLGGAMRGVSPEDADTFALVLARVADNLAFDEGER